MTAGRRMLLLGPVLALAFPAWAQGQRRVALVIGNGAYKAVPPLDNPARDARLIATTLEKLGFSLVGGGAQLDLDRAAMGRAIRSFGQQLGPNAVAVFYYSGHGLQIEGQNYLVPVTAEPQSAADADFELVEVGVVLRQMEQANSSLNLIILDACRNNPFGGRGLRGIATGLAEMRIPRGTIISYATQPGGVARDGPAGGDSPYSAALAEALQTSGIDVFRMFNLVGLKVRQATGQTQTPWVSSSPIDGEFYLAGAPAPAAAIPPAPGSNPEVVFWQSVQNSGNVAELEDYLRRFPDGVFAGLARSRIETLKSAQREEAARKAAEQRAAQARRAAPKPRPEPASRAEERETAPPPPPPAPPSAPPSAPMPRDPARRFSQ